MTDKMLDNMYIHEMTLIRKQGKVAVLIGENTIEVSAACSVSGEATVTARNDAN